MTFRRSFQSFNQKMIAIDQKWSILIKKRSKSITIIETWSKFDRNRDHGFESDQNRRSKSASLESEWLKIRFQTPNHIGLVQNKWAPLMSEIRDILIHKSSNRMTSYKTKQYTCEHQHQWWKSMSTGKEKRHYLWTPITEG